MCITIVGAARCHEPGVGVNLPGSPMFFHFRNDPEIPVAAFKLCAVVMLYKCPLEGRMNDHGLNGGGKARLFSTRIEWAAQLNSSTHDVLFGREMGRFSTMLSHLALIFSTKENHGCLRTSSLQKSPSMPTKTLSVRSSPMPPPPPPPGKHHEPGLPTY